MEQKIEHLFLIGVFVFLIGILIGILIGLFIGRVGKGRIRSQLSEIDTEFNIYRKSVDSHFVVTANLINKLTDNFRDIHEHMSESAHKLSKNENLKTQIDDRLLGTNAILSNNTKARTRDKKITDQPRDYAQTSVNSDDVGMLSEEFSLKGQLTADLMDKEKKSNL